MSNYTCLLLADDYSRQTVTNIAYAAFFIVKPICLILDFIGHCLCFLAYYKESKSNGLYSFQLYDAIAKAADTLSAFLLLATFKWSSGTDYEGVEWFQKNYVLMWYSAHMAIAFNDMTTTIKLLISLAMTIDRMISIGLPTRYKEMNRKLWEAGTVTFSVVIGIGASIFMCFYYVVIWDGDRYKIVGDQDFRVSAIATVLVNFRNVLWGVGLIALVATGFLVVYLYHKRMVKVATMTGAQAGDKKEKMRRAAEKTLFLLTIYHSAQAANEITILTAQTLLAFRNGFATCEGRLYSPLRNIEIALINASDFYIMVSLNKAFRQMIRKGLPFRARVTSTAGSVINNVQSIGVQPAPSRHSRATNA